MYWSLHVATCREICLVVVEIVARTSAGASDLADSTRPNVAEPGAQSAKEKDSATSK